MFIAFTLLTIQAVLGGIDNLWHHEITERLPARRAAAGELSLHALREFLYAFIFLGLAWFRWEGCWTFLIIGVLILEIAVTLADFVVEDKTRRLPAFERVLHTVLALNYGAVLASLAPGLMAWAKLPSNVLRTSHAFSWIFTVFGFGLIIWSLRNAVAVLSLRRPPEWVRSPISFGSSPTPRTVLVSGATGFIGGHLVRRLIMRGDKVIVLTRHSDLAMDRFGPHVRVVTNLDSLDESTRIDAIVNLAGAPILGFPWTHRRRSTLLSSRVNTTRALTSLMSRLTTPVRVFVSASAIGFYGVGGDELIDERSRPTSIFQSQLCQDWEAAARAAARLGARLVRVRIGLVLGNDGGALRQMLIPIRLGLGAVIGSGAQWVSWIHVDDLVRLLEFSIDTPRVSGALNAVSPHPVTHRQFQEALAHELRRPLWLRVPALALRAALGEMSQLLVDGQRVVPSRATALGFKFRHRRIQEALSDLLDTGTADHSPSEVYYNGDCPVCRTEMKHYATLCANNQPQLQFIDSMQGHNEFVKYGLRREHLERRVYRRDARGRVLSGMPALVYLWSKIPAYRWLSRTLTLPVLRPISILLYDHVVAPSLAVWANRREMSRASPRHGWF
ncbi:MAG TPA: TIGR01777 family oxidoreductase [Steroidobacteraceae bacterium]